MRPRFGFGRGKGDESPEDVDATAWLIQSSMAEFLLLHTVYIKYMVMFGYTYLHGASSIRSLFLFSFIRSHIILLLLY
jgi:hypothetical protein